MPTPLCPAELVELRGVDAIAFAHAQFTIDVDALEVGSWQWSAWLDAYGRVRNFFALLHPASSQLIAWLPLGGADAMRDALSRYVFRAKVDLQVARWTLHALAESEIALEAQSSHVIAYKDGFALRQPGPEPRLAWLARGDAARDATALEQWRLADVEAGLPLLAPVLGGEFLPQALGLQRVDAIRFDKGCYPGQEIAARVHFRGGNKRRLCRIGVDAELPLPAASLLSTSGVAIGRVLYSAPRNALHSAALAVVTEPQPSEARTVDGARVVIELQ